MDCKTARLLLDLACPHADELASDDVEALDHHLAACPPCADLAQRQRRLDHHLGLAMRQVAVPQGLRGRILAKVAPAATRRWPLHAARGLAAAAALLLLVWGWWHWRAAQHVAPDPGAILTHVNHPAQMDRGQVREAFSRLGVRANPPDLDYAYLSHYGIGELPGMPGTRVPFLEFVRDEHLAVGGTARARVYLLASDAFDLDALPGRADLDQGYRYNLQIRKPANGRTAYLIFHTGDDLNWLNPGPA